MLKDMEQYLQSCEEKDIFNEINPQIQVLIMYSLLSGRTNP